MVNVAVFKSAFAAVIENGMRPCQGDGQSMGKFCTGCGQPTVVGSKFCPQCGSALTTNPPSAVRPIASNKPVLIPNLTPGSLIDLAGRVGLGIFGLWVLCVVRAFVLLGLVVAMLLVRSPELVHALRQTL